MTPDSEPIRRWDLCWAYLDPAIGVEQKGRRPVLVVSNDAFNSRFPVVTVLPITKLDGKERRVYPFEVGLPAGTAQLARASIVMPYQVRTVSKERLRGKIGSLDDVNLRARVEDALLDHFGVEVDQ